MDIKTINRTLGLEGDDAVLQGLRDPHGMASTGFRTLQEFTRLLGIPVHQLLVCSDGTITGHLFSFPMKFRFRGDVVEGVSGMDLFVCEEYRKYGHGMVLLDDFFNALRKRVFEAYGISKMADPLYKFCGATTVPVPELSMPVRSRIKLMLAAGGRFRLLSPMVDVFLWCYRMYLKTMIAPIGKFSWRELKEIPAEVDEIVFADKHPYAEWHDVQYLQALKDCAAASNRRFVGAYRGDELVGFYLTEAKARQITVNGKHVTNKVGRVLEWGTRDDKGLPEKLLILHALLQFKGGVDSACVHIVEPEVVDFLQNTCKLKIKAHCNWGIKIGDESPCAEMPGIKDISNWRVRTSMGDVGLY